MNIAFKGDSHMNIKEQDVIEILEDFEVIDSNWPNWMLIDTGVYVDTYEENIVIKVASGEKKLELILSLSTPPIMALGDEEQTCDFIDLAENIIDLADRILSLAHYLQ